MRVKLIMGNWKMHGSHALLQDLLPAFKAKLSARPNVEYVLCPPFVYLSEAARMLSGSALCLGAQNISEHEMGAYTGEVSGAMLSEAGCRYVIVGHSERRQYYGESDALIAKKVKSALQNSLKPVICLGETLSEREAGLTEQVVARQLKAVLTVCSAQELANCVLAYEPVWAIGTGLAATSEQVQKVHHFLRGVLRESLGNVAERMQILYGGSVKASNAAELLKLPDVDGALIGGASLKVDEFVTIATSFG